MELEKSPSQNKKFFNIINLLKRKPVVQESPPEETYAQRENRIFNEKIDYYIGQQMFEHLEVFVKEGVKLNEPQIKRILNRGNNSDYYRPISGFLTNFIPLHKQEIQDIVLKDLQDLSDKLEQYKNMTKKQQIGNDHSDNNMLVYNANHSMNILEIFLPKIFNLKEPEKIVSLYNLLHSQQNTPQSIKQDWFKGLIGHSDLLQTVNSWHIDIERDQLSSMANKIKTIRSHDIKDLMTLDFTKNIQNFSLNNLPLEAKNLVNELSEIFTELNIHHKTLNTSQNLLLENMQNKRLPQVLQEYISIPERYRMQLNQGADKPDTLLVSSLNEIKQNISELIDVVKSSSLDNMKKTNIYLKSI